MHGDVTNVAGLRPASKVRVRDEKTIERFGVRRVVLPSQRRRLARTQPREPLKGVSDVLVGGDARGGDQHLDLRARVDGARAPLGVGIFDRAELVLAEDGGRPLDHVREHGITKQSAHDRVHVSHRARRELRAHRREQLHEVPGADLVERQRAEARATSDVARRSALLALKDEDEEGTAGVHALATRA